ncbi:MAG: hypothetical protein A2X49_09335 [Lentisphaerae bacterium GWF2_52_8]|nr:MAG: hypothetical protein A2X49_09335 [Lentisphaerae bacterium GWF2_52_8]
MIKILYVLPLLLFLVFLFLAGICWLFRNELASIRAGRRNFECGRCGRCCGLNVNLTEEDVARIVKAGHSEKSFAERRFGIRLLKKEHDKCVFFSAVPGTAGACRIYEHRPAVCRRFPALKYFGFRGLDLRCPSVSKAKR